MRLKRFLNGKMAKSVMAVTLAGVITAACVAVGSDSINSNDRYQCTEYTDCNSRCGFICG